MIFGESRGGKAIGLYAVADDEHADKLGGSDPARRLLAGRVLLAGGFKDLARVYLPTPEQVEAGKAILSAVSGEPVADSLFEEVRMDVLRLPLESPAAGHSLSELAPAQRYGVQIAGLRRGGVRILNPGAVEILRGGDELLVLGAPTQISDFKMWLLEPPEGGPAQ